MSSGPTTLSPGTGAPEAQAVVPDHTLVQLIGRGSYGEVWLARNVLGTMRAVKIVQRRAFEEERPYEREFLGIQKFEPVSRSHEGLVDVLQVGRNDKERYFYYIMELADDAEDNPNSESRNPHAQTSQGRGERSRHSSLGVASSSYVPKTLSQEIGRRGRLPVEECVRLGLSLAGAVAHLHNKGLIHRDIKPSNIIFVNGLPKLADIGLVSEAGSSRSYVGTEGYIPPEGPGTPQADLYSLGKLIYEASTGKDRTEFPALPLEVTRPGGCNGLLELNSIFLKACVSDPRDRYQSAEQMQHDLTLLQVGKSVRRLQRMERQVKLLTRAGVMGSLVTVLALGGYAYAHRQARLQRESAARIERAEREGHAQLRQALLAQARALRQSGQGGRRFESLKAISKAAAISVPAEYRPASIKELRNEATACLALVDLRATPLKPGLPSTNITVDLDLDRYAIADSRGAVQVRRLSNNELVAELPGQTKAIEMLFHFSPNGQFLPISYHDSPALIWDLNRGSAVLRLRMGDNHFRRFDFSPDSLRVAIGSDDLSLVIYNVLDGAMLKQFTNGPYTH